MEIIDSLAFCCCLKIVNVHWIFLKKIWRKNSGIYLCKSFDDNSLWCDRLKEYKKELNMLLGTFFLEIFWNLISFFAELWYDWNSGVFLDNIFA